MDNCENLKIGEKFDFIFGNSILHHLDNEKACNSMLKTLKPDGKILFLEPLGKNPLINLYRRLTPNQRTPDEHPFIDKDFEIYKEYFNLELTYFSLFNVFSLPFLDFQIGGKIYEFTDKIDRNFRHILGPYYWICIIEGNVRD